MLNSNALLRASAWTILVIAAAFVVQIEADPVQGLSLLLATGAIAITGLNWYEHRGGRSASFLFLALGCILLTGRAFPALLGGESQLAVIGFRSDYSVQVDVVTTYALLVLASFFLIHIGSLIPRAPRVVLVASTSDAKIYFWMFIALLPIYLYKNVFYLSYVIASGDYLAIYQDRGFVENIGIPIRIGALLCLAAFTLYFFHEASRKKSLMMLILFLIIFSIELLIGLRGKYFIVALVMALFYKIRFGGRFSIRGLLSVFGVVFGLSLIIEIWRQGGTSIQGSVLVGFLVQQGITAGVSLVVIDDLQTYAVNAIEYFWRQFLAPFYGQPDVAPGWFLQNDISMRVMPEAYALGYGSGSSYLAELYLLAGWPAVCLASLIIGILLSVLSRFYQGVTGAIMFWALCGLAYYPKAMLQEPVHNLMRYAGPILFLAACCWLVRRIWNVRRMASAR